MLVLGIDPGTATTGYGVVKANKNSVNEVIEFGLIETDKDTTPGARLVDIVGKMDKVIKRFSPDVVAIEKLFFATNAKTAIRVGQAQGVMLYAFAKRNVKVFEYAPGTIKKIISGDGRADKKDVQKAVRKYLGAKVRSKVNKKTHFDNAADALAIALCHIISMKGGE
ncbi:crossover junction endodeoxyribonuclease RuvC [Patescibacteria group bacterium]